MTQNQPYTREVARIYDLLVYGRQDVEADQEEMAFLRWAFREVCPRQVKRILDVGCGTGRHVIPLVREGYDVTGLDNSAGMIEECHKKLDRRGLDADLHEQDLGALDYDSDFDAVLCMNSVVCFLLETERIVSALRGFRRALRPGGVLLLDNWNFFAQLGRFGYPYQDVRGNEAVRIEYEDYHWLDDFTSIYHVEITARVTERDRSYEIRWEEALRAMTVGETEMYLKEAGFADISAYPSFDVSQAGEPCGERMMFLALRAEAEARI